MSAATSPAIAGSTSSWPVKRRCRAEDPGGSEIITGSSATKAGAAPASAWGSFLPTSAVGSSMPLQMA